MTGETERVKRMFRTHRPRSVWGLMERAMERHWASKFSSHDTIFLTRWRKKSYVEMTHTDTRFQFSQRDRELFLISKDRANIAEILPVSGVGLGGEWRGLPITRD
jgi:hypothetical protein